MGDWPIGFSTGCFYNTPIFDCLEAVKAAGFSMVEVCSFPAHLDYHDTASVKKAAAEMESLHLEAYSMHAPFADHIDITALDSAEREQAAEELMRATEAAHLLGVRYLVLHPGPERSDLPSEERLQRMQNAVIVLNQVAGRCQELGIELILENMLPHLFSGNVCDLLWLLGAMNTSRVGVCLDTGHAFLSGDFDNVVQKLSRHLWMIHASDNNGSWDDHLPPGQGKVPWMSFCRRLDQIGFRGAVILELSGNSVSPSDLHEAQVARLFLRKLSRGSR